jgi:hypothetical protein
MLAGGGGWMSTYMVPVNPAKERNTTMLSARGHDPKVASTHYNSADKGVGAGRYRVIKKTPVAGADIHPVTLAKMSLKETRDVEALHRAEAQVRGFVETMENKNPTWEQWHTLRDNIQGVRESYPSIPMPKLPPAPPAPPKVEPRPIPVPAETSYKPAAWIPKTLEGAQRMLADEKKTQKTYGDNKGRAARIDKLNIHIRMLTHKASPGVSSIREQAIAENKKRGF